MHRIHKHCCLPRLRVASETANTSGSNIHGCVNKFHCIAARGGAKSARTVLKLTMRVEVDIDVMFLLVPEKAKPRGV